MPLNLPERASYDYLKKLAKERLAMLRARNAATKLADAQLAIAREYGFSSWRALKTEMDLRQAPNVAAFMRACATGDVDTLRELLQRDPSLARQRLAGGTTALHGAVRHPEAVRLLLEYGADPNARDLGDNATPLHFAAAHGAVDSARVLLDAGADVHGTGDAHNGDVIGWAAREGNEAVINLLLERGVRWAGDPTADKQRVKLALGSIQSRGGTAVMDGLYTAVTLPTSKARSLIVLFSDGEDNLSWLDDKQVKAVVERSNALVHVVGIVPGVGPGPELSATAAPQAGLRQAQAVPQGASNVEPIHNRTLRQIAEATGGRFWPSASPDRLRETFAAIAEAMSHRYVLRFEPPSGRKPGWHRLELKLRGKPGRIEARRGYWVGAR